MYQREQDGGQGQHPVEVDQRIGGGILSPPASMGHRARYMDTMSTEAVVVLTLRPMLRVRTTPTPGIPAMNIQSPTGLLTG